MHLIIYPDGRTSRHGDLGDLRSDIVIPERTDVTRARESLDCDDILALPCEPLGPTQTGTFTLWVREATVTRPEGLRNIPASLLAAQWGRPLRLLAGPVVVTHSGSEASAFVVSQRWDYVTGLVEDITRAVHGLTPHSRVMAPAWPEFIQLAAAALEAQHRETAPDMHGDAALAFLMREMDIEVVE